MNVETLRQYYNYHFAMNRFMWEQYVSQLTDEQFNQPIEYSLGSIRNQIVHMISVDEGWFRDLRGFEMSESIDPDELTDRVSIRAYWDRVEQFMREYLASLQDQQLFETPLEGEDQDLILWQILLHVANHGTDHRAQTLRLIHDCGIKTTSQDYVFYLYDVHSRHKTT